MLQRFRRSLRAIGGSTAVSLRLHGPRRLRPQRIQSRPELSHAAGNDRRALDRCQLIRRVRSECDDLVGWWTVMNDPLLNQLMVYAYRQNLTLREAGFRVFEARAQYRHCRRRSSSRKSKA